MEVERSEWIAEICKRRGMLPFRITLAPDWEKIQFFPELLKNIRLYCTLGDQ
jgi:hypothetical protein